MDPELKGTHIVLFSLIVSSICVLVCHLINPGPAVKYCSLLILMSLLIAMGLYMYLTGKGTSFINAPVAWSGWDEDIIKSCTSYIGLFFTAGFTILTVGISLLFLGFGISGKILLLIIVVTILLVLWLMIYPIRKVHNVDFALSLKPIKERNLKEKWTVFAAALIIVLAPCTAMFCMSSNDDISIVLSDDSFRVKGPMFDQTFRYDKVDSLELDTDFDKGSRRIGMGSEIISSGTYSNDEFGTYELASYTGCQYCIVIEYEDKMYAFNQSTESETQILYDSLSSKCNNIIT